jgi:cobaltochelatase CobS
MATHNSFNFSQSNNPALSARIASIHGNNIAALLLKYTGRSVSNMAVTYAKPGKANGAIDLINKCPDDRMPALIADLEQYERQTREYNAAQPGKPISQYVHDTNAVHTNAPKPSPAPRTPTQTIKVETIESILDDVALAPTPKQTPRIDDNTGNPLVDAIRAEINGALETLDLQAGTNADEVNALIKAALDTFKASHQTTHVSIDLTRNNETRTIDAGLQHSQFPMLLQFITAGFPVWIPGPAGSGKTTAIRNACKHLDATLYMPPEGPIENKYGMIGYCDATGRFNETTLYRATCEARDNPTKLIIYFIDECDAGYANALVVLNAVMENGYCTFANGERVEFGANLQFIAAANTYGNGATHEYVGRNKLDAATLDRFVTLAWDYDDNLERSIAGNDAWVNTVQAIRAKVRELGIKQVVSPRASIRGAKLLAMGISRDVVLNATVYKGMTADQVRTVGVN